MSEIIETLKEPYASLFIIIVFGVLLSKIQFKNVGLGSSGIVIAAIFFGYMGFSAPPSIEKIGLILFIFAVGIQAGPGFFESFKTGEARQYLVPVTLTLGIIFTLVLGMSYLMGFDYLLAAGLFSGVTTSTPTLAAIIENSKTNSSILTYTLSYPVAMVTTILSFRFLPKIIKLDVKREEEDYSNETEQRNPQIITKNFLVKNPNIYNKKIGEINFHSMTKAVISRVQKEDENLGLIPNPKTELSEGDLVKVVGEESAIESAELILGPCSDKKIGISPKENIISVLVTHRGVIGKTLVSLNVNSLFGAEITQIRRSGVNLVPRGSTRLRFGDKLQVSVNEDMAPNLIKMLGGIESSTIDFLPLSISIVLGILIGQISIPIGTTQIGPGVSGGILFTTLILGRIGKTGPMLWSIAGKTNQFLRELGMMLFLCGVGSTVGKNIIHAFTQEGLKTVAATIFITVLAIGVASLVILKFQKMNKLRYIGALAGSLTCAAALPPASEIDNSTIPLTAYSVSYPFALLLTIFLGQVFVMIGTL